MSGKRGSFDEMIIKYSFQNFESSMFRCGICGEFFGWDKLDKKYKFCPECGSKLGEIKEVKLSGDEDLDKIVYEDWTNGE